MGKLAALFAVLGLYLNAVNVWFPHHEIVLTWAALLVAYLIVVDRQG